MHLEQRTGPVPGLVYATVRQGMTTRTFPIEVRRTASGHYISRMPDNRWSIECLTVEAALLMHAAVLFPVEHELSPWLSNPKPSPHVVDRMSKTAETRFDRARDKTKKESQS